MNGARQSSLDAVWHHSQPYSEVPLAMWRAVEMWLGIEWAEAKDRSDKVWTRGAFDGLVEVNQIKLSRGSRCYF